MEEYIIIGKIVNTHGIKGEVKIIPLTDNPDRYNDLEYVLIDRENTTHKHFFKSIRFFKNFVIAKLSDVDTMNDAEKLKNCEIKIERKNAIKLDEDQYFIFDLIGCQVYDENEKLLGKITEVLQTGSNDVYIVEADNKKQILIPAIKSVINRVSIDERVVNVTIPEGLLDEDEI